MSRCKLPICKPVPFTPGEGEAGPPGDPGRVFVMSTTMGPKGEDNFTPGPPGETGPPGPATEVAGAAGPRGPPGAYSADTLVVESIAEAVQDVALLYGELAIDYASSAVYRLAAPAPEPGFSVRLRGAPAALLDGSAICTVALIVPTSRHCATAVTLGDDDDNDVAARVFSANAGILEDSAAAASFVQTIALYRVRDGLIVALSSVAPYAY